MSDQTTRRKRLPAGVVMTDLARKCAEHVGNNAIERAKAMADLREQLADIYPEAAEIENEWWGQTDG